MLTHYKIKIIFPKSLIYKLDETVSEAHIYDFERSEDYVPLFYNIVENIIAVYYKMSYF